MSQLDSHSVKSKEGTVVRIVYEQVQTGFRIFRVESSNSKTLETWLGNVRPIHAGMYVQGTGIEEIDSTHGSQFRVNALVSMDPSTMESIIKFLGSGMIHGIGPTYARRIVEAFGEKTLSILDASPDRLLEVSGLGKKRAKEIISGWKKHRGISSLFIFLGSHNIRGALATKIHKQFGERTMEVVNREPYRLCMEVSGIGFKTADQIAQSVGIDRDSLVRLQAGLFQTLRDSLHQGHVYVTKNELIERTLQLLEQPEADLEQPLKSLAQSRHIHIEERGDSTWITLNHLFQAEVECAQMLETIVKRKNPKKDDSVANWISTFEKKRNIQLASAQREAIVQASQQNISMITGGPGVGKTTVISALIEWFHYQKKQLKLAAPTGRAAKRMKEATGHEATTLHRLLEYEPKNHRFARGRDLPIEASVLIVDECSMIDLELMHSLLKAIGDLTKVVFIGDANQLPSIGPGAILKDMIASKVIPSIELTEIFRQSEASLIVKNAHSIHEGIIPQSSLDSNSDFYILERKTPESAIDTLIEIVTKRIPQKFGFDPIRDIQILAPMHRGEVGTISINTKLQAVLNPTGDHISNGSRILRKGDKVIQLQNDYDREVFNGDVGRIAHINREDNKIIVQFEERMVEYSESDLDRLGLAYAISVHKSQGSEYPVVVIPLLSQHFMMLSRNLLYTGVTRAKKLVVLIADPKAIKMALNETRKEQRKTMLEERLRKGSSDR